MPPFQFAVCGDAPSAKDWRDLATRSEDYGYTTLFVADHYHLQAGGLGYPPQYLAPFPAIVAAAAWTSKLRVGTRVACIDYHLPAVLAKEAATIDLLSEGRLILGLGAGWHEAEYEAMDLVFADAPTRVQKLEEVIVLCKAHWSGEPFKLDGQEVRVRDYVGLPVPAARPHLSLMIGGSKKRVLSIAACEGDIVSLSNVIASGVDTVAEIETQVGYVRDAAGERFDELDIELMPLCVEITDDPDSALERLSPMFGVEPEFLRDHPLVLVGSLDHLVDELEKRRAVFGVNYVTIPQYFVDAFAPVVSCLTGR